MYKFITVLCFVLFVSTSCADSPEKQQKEFSKAAKAKCIQTIKETFEYIEKFFNETLDVPETAPNDDDNDDGDRALLEMGSMMTKSLIKDINETEPFGKVKETNVFGNFTISCNDKIHDTFQSIINVLDQINNETVKKSLKANRRSESTTSNQKIILHGEKMIADITMVPYN